MADLFASVYNPDVLSCLANLSNDEVFTPPELANQVLDMLPESIWLSTTAKFLDPCSKSGVFLREIAKRLIRGQLPDFEYRTTQIDAKRIAGEDLDGSDEAYLYRLQKVLDHIFHEQIYGIAITELTSLLTRRSVYCSKWANSPYSVVQFTDTSGNIRFRRLQHAWEGPKGKEKCKYCKASKKELTENRSSSETHAYEFIHTVRPERIIQNMQFDVVIGNPPYQLSDGGYRVSASPIYQNFVSQAIKLSPRYLTMIIPSRWFSGGKGLDAFRNQMLHDDRLSQIHDYPNANDCFPGVQIKGGVCYFLWDRDHHGECLVTSHTSDGAGSSVRRPLLEKGNETFIRWNEAVDILHKVQARQEKSFEPLVSARKPFGFDTLYRGGSHGDIVLYQNGGVARIKRTSIHKNMEWVDKWKVFIPEAGSGSDAFPHPILGKPFVGSPGSACTETYLVLGPFRDETECRHVIEYVSSRVFRFLVLLKKPSQHATSKVYSFVPQQDWSEPWDDKKLCQKYGITDKEYEFICTLVRPAGE